MAERLYDHLWPEIKRLYLQGLITSEIAERLKESGENISKSAVYSYQKNFSDADRRQHKAARVPIKRDKLRQYFLEDAKNLPWRGLRQRYRNSEQGILLLKEYFPERFLDAEPEVAAGRTARRNNVLDRIKKGLRRTEIGKELGVTASRIGQIIEEMQEDPEWQEALRSALDQGQIARAESREAKLAKLREAITAEAKTLNRPQLVARYGRSRNGRKIINELFPLAEREEMEEIDSYVGQKINGFLATKFLGRKKPNGEFSTLRAEFKGNPSRSTFYYEVKCLNCEDTFARSKSTFVNGLIGCSCRRASG